jgi:hypothetical protein
MIVSIDPDTKASGLAFFGNGVLIDARATPLETDDEESAWSQITEFLGNSGRNATIVCEMPQMYGRVGDQRDFLAVARIVGRFEQIAAEHCYGFEAVTPKQWKGETPKQICTLRAFEALSPYERERLHVPPAAERALRSGRGLKSGVGSDVLDAVGIGLWFLGRFGGRTLRVATPSL